MSAKRFDRLHQSLAQSVCETWSYGYVSTLTLETNINKRFYVYMTIQTNLSLNTYGSGLFVEFPVHLSLGNGHHLDVPTSHVLIVTPQGVINVHL